MPRIAGPVVVSLVLSLAGPASARTKGTVDRVALEYRRLSGAERCPSRAELEARVTEILGHRPFARQARRLVRCVLRGTEGVISARVQLVERRSGRVLGVRELSGPGAGCEEIGGAMALAIALAIDPLARPPTPRPPPAAASASASARPTGPGAPGVASPPRVSPEPRSSRAPEARRLPDTGPLTTLGLAPLAVARMADAGMAVPAALDAGPPADAGVAPPDAGPPLALLDAGVPVPPADAGAQFVTPDAGVAPVLAEAPAVTAAASPPPPPAGWRPVLGVDAVGAAGVVPGFGGGLLVHAGAASSTASVEVEGRWLPGTSLGFGTGTISASLVSGALVGCARFGSWAACGLTEAGPLSARGQGYSRSQEASAWRVSLGARAQWEWLFADPVGLRLHLDGVANLVRPRLLVDSQAAWTTPPLSVWVGGGLFGRF